MADRIEELRSELSSVDRQILELAARRRQLAQQIGRAKQVEGRPTRDFEREKVVVTRACKQAAELGLSEQLARRLTAELIRASLTVQEQDRVADRAQGDGRRALVIGGGGRMGGWLVAFLASQGYEVQVADPAGGPAGVESCPDHQALELDHDLIAVAAPLGACGRILADLAVRKPPGVIFDVGSLKSPLRGPLHALVEAGCQVCSIHPMFGPDTDLLSGRHIILIDLGRPHATATVRGLFSPTMATLVDMDLESHDRHIAFVLGLSHAVNIVFFTALADSRQSAPELQRLSSTTFDAQLEVARRVAAENPHLYFEIQALNDYGLESLKALESAVQRLHACVQGGDLEGFVGMMQRGLGYLAGE